MNPLLLPTDHVIVIDDADDDDRLVVGEPDAGLRRRGAQVQRAQELPAPTGHLM